MEQEQFAVPCGPTDAEYEAAGYTVQRTGKMVPGDNGKLVEQVIITPSDYWPYYTPRPQPASGTIYFIGPEGGPIKIGFTSKLEPRLRDLRLANAFHLEVRATVEGPPAVERDYHKRFATHRLHGEWFSPHPDILAEIDRLNT